MKALKFHRIERDWLEKASITAPRTKTAIELKAYDTRYSQPVTHASTNRAQRCLTSEIRRDRVYSTWYGRRRRRASF